MNDSYFYFYCIETVFAIVVFRIHTSRRSSSRTRDLVFPSRTLPNRTEGRFGSGRSFRFASIHLGNKQNGSLESGGFFLPFFFRLHTRSV
jgi:hypothetical protein